ncbi:hypothetical protein KHA80_05015 [Anaerobacillus sp. HL2]|nr:hypothetical protein KHA80_05015 [Anaerobacillus sp. HL2]
MKKWKSQATTQNNSLIMHVPPTDRLRNKQQLFAWLDKHSSIYIKPVLSSKGDGITVISKRKSYEIKTNKECNEYSLTGMKFG